MARAGVDLDSSRGGGRRAHFPPAATPLRPGVRSPRGGSVRPGRRPAREACAWRRPTGRADRPGPRSTADDGTLTRERHRLACGSPSRAPGRRPGGVTLGFSDRCPVPDGDGDIRFRTARGGRRDLQHGARRRGLDSSRGGGRRTSRPLPRCRAPVVRSPRGGSVRPGRRPAREACAWRRPTGRADRPGPRSTADDGTLTRERHRLACGSPSRAPGRRPGGVTLGFSDRCPVPRWRRRPPVPCSPVVVDEISSMARVGVDWTAHAAVAGALPAHCHAAAHRLSGLPGAVLSDQGVGQHEKLVHGGARRVEPTETWPPFNGRRRNADAGAASTRLRLALPRPRS